ncbi:hypothetical protein C0966_00070 [Bacillus methanolicus]|uniref:DUF3147 family protein n=1 Tax=Bacillus methanolicus TaxID=1471 RepID=UPI002380A302|nr:DUF3147 family protein [Bacillus methanolicus]MDE3837803.1 hypothetical protein [Bacillus methanolicus]
MDKKDLIIRFLLGGTAVMLSYLVTIISPWKLLSGIFAAFPAVMLTAVFMMGISSGSKKAAKIAQGSVYGMIGGVVCVATVLAVLKASNNWVLSIFAGLLLWLISSIFISTLREQIKNFSIKEKAGTN